MNNVKKYEKNKKDFLELYKNAKSNKVDLNTVPIETLKKMCMLIKEEIKMKEDRIEKLKAKLNGF